MAQIFPEDFQIENKEFRFSSEIGTLLRLQSELPDQYSVFHGIHWTRIEEDAAIYGEIDFLILNQYGKKLKCLQSQMLFFSLNSLHHKLKFQPLLTF
jgi:hypothetical protein